MFDEGEIARKKLEAMMDRLIADSELPLSETGIEIFKLAFALGATVAMFGEEAASGTLKRGCARMKAGKVVN